MNASRHPHTMLASLVMAVGIFFFSTAFTAHAASLPVQGYAWSDYLGALHFNGSGYGVYEDSVTGALSGYAWSPFYGWVSFNSSDLVGCPSGSCSAQVDLGTGAVTGWAHSCAAFSNKNACSGSYDSGTGGWDGWIHLTGGSYGVTSSYGCWSGYAWGSQNIGYIHFAGTATNGTTYKVGTSACGASPDLTVTAATTQAPTVGTVGDSEGFTGIVQNIGVGYAANFPNIIQIANSDQSSTVALLNAGAVSALEPGGSTNVTAVYTFSQSGVYSVRTCANFNTSWAGSISESNSNNNCGPWATFTVKPVSCTSTLTATPDTIDQGGTVALSWSVPDGSLCASSCSGSGFNAGGAISGSNVAPTVVPTPPTTSYALTCTGGTYGPPPPANATVTVRVPSITTLTANDQRSAARVNPTVPNNTTLKWTTTNASSCALTKNGVLFSSALNSSGTVDSVSVQSIYAIDCVNSHGTHATSSVEVNILPNFQEF